MPEETAKNDDSLVMEMSYGRQRALLTGDAEQPIESELVARDYSAP